ncbi:hypothetical protein D3C87_324210 [compost metagenome]
MISWDREDINDMIKKYLTECLRIQVSRGDFTDPNSRKISLYLDDDDEIAYAYFDVVQKDEYGG